MPRLNSGTVRVMNNDQGVAAWHAKWTRADGTRSPWLPLPGTIALDDRPAAKAAAARLAPKVRAASAPSNDAPTVREWIGRLHKAKEAKGLATVKDMRGRATRWVFPVFGDVEMRAVTREHGERLVASLDAAVAAFMKQGPGKGRLSPSIAANVWGDVQHAFDEAVNAKDPGLRVLETNPIAGVRGPDAGTERQGQILYGDELVALLPGINADPDKLAGVPLYRRQTYAVAVYTKARASELEALTADDVDLEHHTITIAKQADPTSKGRKKTKQTKTKRVRTIDIEPHLLPLVTALVKRPQGKVGRLLHMPPPEDRAELLRKDLHTVGVTRPALFVEGDPLQRAIVFHDLRDTGLCHMAVRGDSPIVIQWAGGHTDFKTTQGYLARGQTERRRVGEPLPALPSGLVPESPEPPPRIVHESSRTIPGAVSSCSHSRNLRPQRELNPPPESARPAEISAAKGSPGFDESPQLTTVRDRSEPIATSRGAETSQAELEAAIVRAVTLGLTEVAQVLARSLEVRRRGPNVIDLGVKQRT